MRILKPTQLDPYALRCLCKFESTIETVLPLQSARNDRYMIYAWCAGWAVTNVCFISWAICHVHDRPIELDGRSIDHSWVPETLTGRSRRHRRQPLARQKQTIKAKTASAQPLGNASINEPLIK